jgi:hypothetical protein
MVQRRGFKLGLDYPESAESIQLEHNSTEKDGCGGCGTAECHSNLSVHMKNGRKSGVMHVDALSHVTDVVTDQICGYHLTCGVLLLKTEPNVPFGHSALRAICMERLAL